MATLHFTFPSKILRSQAEIRACLPDEGVDCPTLWVLHGANCDADEWFDSSSIARLAARRKLAVVSTSVFNGFGVNMAHGAPYADYLETEWIPAARAVLQCLSVRREQNFIAGASMGGYAAFRLALNQPALFSRAAAFAGAIALPTIFERFQRGIQPGHDDLNHAFGSYANLVNNRNDVIWLAKRRVAEGTAPRLYMYCGTEDFGYALNTIARDDLRHAGADVTWSESPGEHSFACWDRQLPAFLDWLEVGEA
jgi:putative tributyrin esterase